MSAMPQFWILRVMGIAAAAVLGIFGWTLHGLPLILKKTADDFAVDLPAPGWLLSSAGSCLVVPAIVCLVVVVVVFVNPKSSIHNLVVGWCLLTAIAVILSVVATLIAAGFFVLIGDLS